MLRGNHDPGSLISPPLCHVTKALHHTCKRGSIIPTSQTKKLRPESCSLKKAKAEPEHLPDSTAVRCGLTQKTLRLQRRKRETPEKERGCPQSARGHGAGLDSGAPAPHAALYVPVTPPSALSSD